MDRKKRKVVIWICCLVLFLTAIIPESIYASEAATDNDNNTIRIGCATSTGYHQKTDDGDVSGYGDDYEQALAQYAGWNIEYVDGSWTQLQNMLETGEIDMLGFMVKNTEREEKYDFAQLPSGTSMSCLVTNIDNSELTYENYGDFNGITVGYQQGNGNLENFQEYCIEHNFQVNLIKYATYQDVFDAVDSGVVDAGIMTNYQDLSNYNIIAQFLPTDYYYAVKKGNTELLQSLNDAITDINTYLPNYKEELYNRYYGEYNFRGMMFTQEEMDYLASKPVVEIVPACRQQPYEYYDSKTGKYEGIIPDILKELTAITGIEFQYVTDVERWDYLKEKEGNVITSFTDNFDWANEKNLNVTQPFVKSEVAILLNNADDPIRTAALCNQDFLNYSVQKAYPDWKVTTYANPQECVEAVLTGETDCTLLNTHEAEYYLSMGKYQSLTQLVSGDIDQDISFGVSHQSDPMLYSVLSKAQLMISSDIYDAIVMENMASATAESTMDIVYTHPVQVIGICVLLIMLLLGVITLLFYVRAMRRKNQQIEMANRDKMDFFSRMSHDMRTPMNGILGMLDIAEDEQEIDEVKNCIGKAKNSGQYMLSLINDTLDLQKLESGKMHLEYQTTRGLTYLQEMVEMVRPSAELKGIHLYINNKNLAENSYVKLDPVRVKQVFTNLMSNAVKFTPEGGTVEFMAENLGYENHISHNKFMVRDTGIGMSQEFIQNNMFKAYSQEHSAITDKYAGSGLGLAIVKNLVDIMGGRIEVESELGKGTTYTIYLDFEVVDESLVQADQSKNENSKEQYKEKLQGKHILLCEDHPVNAEIVQRLLQKKGCQVDWAENGKIGLEMFQQSEPGTYDAVLMDIRMPVMDGIQAAKEIRKLQREDAKKVKIIAVTANAYDEDIKHSLEAGMNGHLSKPIESDLLYELLTQ